jgi:CDP-glucose 4,6-dehydratase
LEGLGLNPEFWKGKKVFISGHTGFKGSWLCLILHSLGAKITGYALQPRESENLFTLLRCHEITNSIINDIRNLDKLQSCLRKSEADIVFHFAAQPLVSESYIAPIETYTTNVIGTANILESSRFCETISSILIITSDKCYENNNKKTAYIETDELGGDDPYSSSKACAEILTNAYRKSFFQKEDSAGIASARAGNVIGGGDFTPGRLLPDIFNSIKNKKAIVLRNPKAVRPWQHVFEALFGYIKLSEKLFLKPKKYSGAWNFGPNDNQAITVESIVSLAIGNWDPKTKLLVNNDKYFYETDYLNINSKKSQDYLNWRPLWDIQTTIEKTVDWYKLYESKKDIRAFSAKQVEEYIGLIK